MTHQNFKKLIASIVGAWTVAGIVTFCSPPTPAHAEAVDPAPGQYVACNEIVKDASSLLRISRVLPKADTLGLIAALDKTQYGKALLAIAADAASSGDSAEYLRAWHGACLKLSI